MLDLSLIRTLEPDLEAAVRNAILTLANSGILDMQLATAFESISAGSVSEDPHELAAKIVRYRQENHGIIALKLLADDIKKESNNA